MAMVYGASRSQHLGWARDGCLIHVEVVDRNEIRPADDLHLPYLTEEAGTTWRDKVSVHLICGTDSYNASSGSSAQVVLPRCRA